MNAIPTEFSAAWNDAAPPRAAASALGEQWAALQEAASAVAAMAGVAPEPPAIEVIQFPEHIEGTGGWRRDLAVTGVADLAAMMTPGLRALLAVTARGQNPAPAALSLWGEYLHARGALIALVPGRCTAEPLREA
ncbi:hypothetical protein GRI40_09020 [Altererythrobacter aerius]|uniref:Uncharacterized protein n=1 Tax=Tsuneonella aeria TaxID=1837929 RepID=A0A6I4TDP3_9SPHN|nr:hypothetical protein [Tsuneonella aeria]MXO75352.1 hypothetical protein [Tsuneonella aeria]